MKTGKPVAVPKLPVICERIHYYRTNLGMEQKALAKQVGITRNSVCNWENGRSRPDVNLLPGICEALNITLYDLFNLKDNTIKFTARQQMLADHFTRLSDGHKVAVEQMIDTLIKVEVAEECPDIRTLTYYDRQLAAGIGDPDEFEDEGIPIYLYASPEVDRADCVFTVNGNSMEPDYRNGDMVLVRRIPGGPELVYGEIGAFIIGNETYIKEFQEDGLHSHNEKYRTMHFTDEDSVYLIGRVVGVLDRKNIAKESDVKKYQFVHGESKDDDEY